MSRRKVNTYSEVQYSRISDEIDDSQFRVPSPNQVPWRAIALALLLLLSGILMLLASLLIFTEHIDSKYADRMWPLFILGVIMFIPGAYHVFIAYYAYKEVPGFSFQDIPEFD